MKKISNIEEVKTNSSYYHRDNNYEYLEYRNIYRIVKSIDNKNNIHKESANEGYYTDNLRMLRHPLSLGASVFEMTEEECQSLLKTWKVTL